MNDTIGRYAPAHIKRLKDAIEGECDGLAIDDKHAEAILQYVFEDATHALRAAQLPQADAEWLAEFDKLLATCARTVEHNSANNTRISRAFAIDAKAALMAHAAQRPAAQPVKRIAICPETDTLCGHCPTLGIPCEAAAQEDRAATLSEHIEQRLRTWRQSFVNKSGDHLALDDFMDAQSLDDLVDFVCDEFALTALASRPVPPPISDERIEQGFRAHDWSSVPHPFRGSVGFERGVRWAEAQWKEGV